ncbi:hypothetical protein BGZ95_006136 [Linnemannia exigua]|uniref:Fungal lipase-type domain-containing protein n=1 Tax=Linnemannia exigua TaxID=604196 RepID=A0AAD4H8S6_9FUNG|nr:hypothetical protein BGZ95_006136 [Linnemannia exigua]
MTQDEPSDIAATTTNGHKGHHHEPPMSATPLPSPAAVNLPVRGSTFPLDSTVSSPSAQEARKLKQAQRQQTAPPKRPVNPHHLDEFVARNKRQHPFGSDTKPHLQPQSPEKTPDGTHHDTTTSPHEPDSSSPPKKQATKRLKEPLSIRPMSLTQFLTDGLRLYISNVKNPDQIPGTDWFSRVYAMGLLPVLVVSMAFVQGGIGLLVSLINYTQLGARLYKKFFENEIALFDENDYIDPEGTEEAILQLANRDPRPTTHFSYHVATLLLIMSSMSYQRDEKLVAEASKLLLDVTTDKQRDRAAELLQLSEKEIDENATREFGMRFMGISELKTLGGPFAGLFYDDESIVLVFKGTSVLAFNEYLIDVTIQRVDASEYLYGEVHKGFYECLFPDAKPEMYNHQTYDRTNPFNTIMETIFEVAKAAKEKTGKPVNLWLTGHSLGGALAALVMARLQMPLMNDDPLLRKEEEEDEYDEHGHRLRKERSATAAAADAVGDAGNGEEGRRTVLAEMLAQYSDDPELIVLRDCYSVASPKIGDSTFANEFARHQNAFCQASPYKTVYWRVVANEDIVPRLPPAGSVDPNTPKHKHFPPACLHCFKTPQEWLQEEQQEDQQQGVTCGSHTVKQQPPKHLHSLLDYQHVGQLVKVFNAKRIPVVRPSAFETDLSKGVLRGKQAMVELLDRLRKVSVVWRKQSEAAREEYSRKHSAPEQGQAQEQDQEPTKNNNDNKDTTSTTPITPTPSADDPDDQQVLKRARAAQQITDDVAKAQELLDIDELSRLRQPGRLESLLLMIPSLLSHAPAAYQRDLVRGRFYFTSFPGRVFEERVVGWVEDAEREQKLKEEVETLEVKEADSGHVSGDEEGVNVNGVDGGGSVPTGQLVDI